MAMSIEALTKRFWSKVTVGDPAECWEWTGMKIHHGYGMFRKTTAHRFSYQQHYGPIAPGLVICHKCDNPPCVNPAHLFAGTQRENMRDCSKKGRIRNPQFKKLTRQSLEEIRAMLASGTYQRVIAKQFGVSQRLISAIHVGKLHIQRQSSNTMPYESAASDP
jgi:hypothetical protein